MAIAFDWYNLNAARHYPLDTAATGDSDKGENMPPDVLVDCHLRFPETVGRYAYISSLYASANLVSITFLASNAPAIDTDCGSSSSQTMQPFTPLAAISIPLDEFVPGIQFPIDALYPGVGGWVVLGYGAFKNNYAGRFSTVQQGMLAMRTARSYKILPIESLAKLHNSTELTGLVLIKAGNDIEIVKDQRLIKGEWRDAMIIRLSNDVEQSVLSKYIGPCGGRPESNSCLKPAIESINSVKPDCDGNIKLSFTTTCTYPGYEQGIKEGMVIDYCMGLGDACTKGDKLPKDGRLPHDYRDDCAPAELVSLSSEIPSLSSLSLLSSSLSSQSSSSEVCEALPHDEDFSSSSAAGFHVRSGTFDRTSGFYVASHVGTRNLAEWLDCAYDNVVDKIAELELTLTAGGNKSNGGLVLGYARYRTPIIQTLSTVGYIYLLAELDKRSDSFRLMYWTGAGMVELAKAAPIGILYNYEYKIRVEIVDAGGGTATVTCKLYAYTTLIATIAVNTTILHNVAVNSFGVHTNQTITKFSSFHVEEGP